MDDSLSFSTPPDSPLSPFSPVAPIEDEIEDVDPIEPPFSRKNPSSSTKVTQVTLTSEEEIEMEIDDDPPTPPRTQQQQQQQQQRHSQSTPSSRRSSQHRSVYRGNSSSSSNSRESFHHHTPPLITRYHTSSTPRSSGGVKRSTPSSQRRVHQSPEDELSPSPSSLSSSFDNSQSQNSLEERERRERIRERREWERRDRGRERGGRERERETERGRNRERAKEQERRQRAQERERERDILPSSPSSGEGELFQKSSQRRHRPSQEEEEIDDFSDGDPLITMLNSTFSTPSTSTPTTASHPTPTAPSPNPPNTSLLREKEELLPDEDIGSFSPPRPQNDYFRQSPHFSKTPSFSSPSKGRITSPPQFQQRQQPQEPEQEEEEEDIEMDPVPFPSHPSSLHSPRPPPSHSPRFQQAQDREEILDEFRSPNSLSPFPPSRSTTLQRSTGRDKRRKKDHTADAEVEQDVRDDEDDDGLSSVDDLDLDIESGDNVSVNDNVIDGNNSFVHGGRGGDVSGNGSFVRGGGGGGRTFIIGGEEDEDSDDDAIDASFDFGPSGQTSFQDLVEDVSDGEKEEEEEEAIESMSEEELVWERRAEGNEKRGEDPPPSNSLDEERGLGTISLNNTMMNLKKGSPYSTPKNTQKWGKGKNSLSSRKRQRVNENSLQNLMGVAVTRHTQLIRELAHTEGEDGGRRRGGSSGLKMKKIGAVIKKVMGEEKCGDGRGGEATCVVVEARPYVSKQEGKRKLILFIKKKGGGVSLVPGHLCVVTSWYECSRREEGEKGETTCQFFFCENYRVTGAIVSQMEEEKQEREGKKEDGRKTQDFTMRVVCQACGVVCGRVVDLEGLTRGKKKPLSWLKKVDKKKSIIANSFFESPLFSTVRVRCTVCCVYPHPCLRKDGLGLQSDGCHSHFSQFQSMVLVRDYQGWFGLIAIPLSESHLWWNILFNSKGKKLLLPPLRIQSQTNIAKNNEMHSLLQLYQANTQPQEQDQPQYRYRYQQRFCIGHVHSIPLTLLVPSELTKKGEEEVEEEEGEGEGEEQEGGVEEIVLDSLDDILGGVKAGKGGEGFWRISLRGVVDSFLGTSEVDFISSGYLNILDERGKRWTIQVKKTRCFHQLPQLTKGTPILIRHARISRQREGGGGGEEAFSALVFIDEYSVIEERDDEMCE